jgi:hypothetical protein
MSSIHYNRQLFIAGLLFTLHNTEEAFGMRYFVHSETLAIHLPAVRQMVPAIVLITLLGWIAIGWVCAGKNDNTKRFLLTTLLLVFLVNAFIPHILGALYVCGYFPGVVTSVLLYLPFTYWLLPAVYRTYDSRRSFFVAAGQGICLALLALFITQFASYLINLL